MARDDAAGAAATVVTAFALGALTGAAVALLMAPAAGEELRRKIGDKAREGADAASAAARQGREFVKGQREVVATALERGREAYHQARSAGAPVPAGGMETSSPAPGTRTPAPAQGAGTGMPARPAGGGTDGGGATS